MEPMTLGSPSGSPATNVGYLPSFLMGDHTTTASATPRNTLSPNKCGRNLSLATSPVVSTNAPQDFNRSPFGQKTLFGALNSPPPQVPNSGMNNFSGTPLQKHTAAGPPTQGLFDSLRAEKTPITSPVNNLHDVSQLDPGYNHSQVQSGYNDSYYNSFNVSTREIVSPTMPPSPTLPSSVLSPRARSTEFWVTVFGFPPSAAVTILQHFSKCGTIQDKVFPPQNGNWVHIKFSSRLECDKALNFNEKIIGNIMIGVTQCRDPNAADKENMCEPRTPINNKMRPLIHSAYKSVQNETAVLPSPNTPQRSTGIINKAMDLIFGW